MSHPYDPASPSAGNLFRRPAPTGRRPERWEDDYNRPMAYDIENWHHAMANPEPGGRPYGPVRWGDRPPPRHPGGDAGGYRGTGYADPLAGRGGRDDSYARVLGPGHFAGRGPKNYRRADERIHEDLCEALASHPEIDASEIEVRVEHGEVTLQGHVPERRMRRLARDVADSIAGVQDVHTRLSLAGQRH